MTRTLRLLASLTLVLLAAWRAWDDQRAALLAERALATRAQQQELMPLVQQAMRARLEALADPGRRAGDGLVPLDPALPAGPTRLALGAGRPGELAGQVWTALYQRAATLASPARRLPELVLADGVPFVVLPPDGPTATVVELAPIFAEVGALLGDAARFSLIRPEGAFPVLTDGVLEGAPVLWATVEPGLQQRLVFEQSGRSAFLLLGLVGLVGLGGELWRLTRDGLVRRARASERDDLLRRLTHDLRTPAASVLSLSDTLASLPSLSAEERAELAGVLAEEARRLVQGSERLLRAAQGEDGALKIRPVPMDLADWLDAVGARWRHQLPGLRVVCPARPLLVRADPELLSEAVDALIDNAKKYGAPPIVLAASPSGDDVLLSVEDAGEGVHEADRERVFLKLERGSRGQGLGLGLWAARQVAIAHGGTLRLDGARRFELRLPGRPG